MNINLKWLQTGFNHIPVMLHKIVSIKKPWELQINTWLCYLYILKLRLCCVSFRHEKYRTQYRAMFVMNCVVKRDEVLRYKTQQEKKQRNRKRRRGQKTEATADEASGSGPSGMDADEVYHPVNCTECSTEVAVFDKDEVYHFFNILASHCWDTLAHWSDSSPSTWAERIPLWFFWAHEATTVLCPLDLMKFAVSPWLWIPLKSGTFHLISTCWNSTSEWQRWQRGGGTMKRRYILSFFFIFQHTKHLRFCFLFYFT